MSKDLGSDTTCVEQPWAMTKLTEDLKLKKQCLASLSRQSLVVPDGRLCPHWTLQAWNHL